MRTVLVLMFIAFLPLATTSPAHAEPLANSTPYPAPTLPDDQVAVGEPFYFFWDETAEGESPEPGIQPNVSVSGCTGTISAPRDIGADMDWGFHTVCFGTGFLPLSINATLQQERFNFVYENIKTETAYARDNTASVYGEVPCIRGVGSQDFRVSATIHAGGRSASGISREVRLACGG